MRIPAVELTVVSFNLQKKLSISVPVVFENLVGIVISGQSNTIKEHT